MSRGYRGAWKAGLRDHAGGGTGARLGREESNDATIVNIAGLHGRCRRERILKFSVSFRPLATQRVAVEARKGLVA